MDSALHQVSERFRVLIVDDDRSFCDDLSMYLNDKFQIGIAYDGIQALDQIELLKPDVVLLDIVLGNGPDGFEVLEQIRSKASPPQVLMLTGIDDIKKIVQAIKSGAYHYISKPPVIAELINLINLAAIQTNANRRLRYLENQVQRLGGAFVYSDLKMKSVVEMLERVAPTDTTVLIIGESGTGKEVVANHVHELSRRADGPFVPVNCAAISASLMESEFFGYVKGAFTGAEKEREGLFQQANGGTIFLDEIGESSLDLQAKLLRVLENREVRKVSGSKIERLDIRVIAASSDDLKLAVQNRQFNKALYYRLCEYQVNLPPLRARPHDILPLAEYFLGVFSCRFGKSPLEFSPAARDFLMEKNWEGNVRELKNTVQRAVIDCPDKVISTRLLVSPGLIPEDCLAPYDAAKEKLIDDFTRDYLAKQMDRTQGNVTEAARLSGMSRSNFHRLLNRVEFE